MNEGLVPRRYAKALYEFAGSSKADTRVYDLMKTLCASFVEVPAMQEALSNPFVSDADKEMMLTTASGAESKSDRAFVDFLRLLAQNRRLDMARDIALAYVSLYREKHRIYEVHVSSAAPMSGEEEKRLRDLVSRHLAGGTMEYHSSVDPGLIGGFTVSVGNERVDASVSNELKQMRLNLLRK